MKNLIYIILSVIVIAICGCSSDSVNHSAEATKEIVIETEEPVKDASDTKAEETRDDTTDIDVITEDAEPKQTETQKEVVKTEKPDVSPSENQEVSNEIDMTESDSQGAISNPSQKVVISYEPQNIVRLATEKVKAKGKMTLTDNLDRLLTEGSITQEEYNEYYPYDGAGYYSVFIETNLNEARTTSGQKLTSEDAIAQYIADMLVLEAGPYFLIEYAGVYTTGGTDFYEFRCYRA